MRKQTKQIIRYFCSRGGRNFSGWFFKKAENKYHSSVGSKLKETNRLSSFGETVIRGQGADTNQKQKSIDFMGKLLKSISTHE